MYCSAKHIPSSDFKFRRRWLTGCWVHGLRACFYERMVYTGGREVEEEDVSFYIIMHPLRINKRLATIMLVFDIMCRIVLMWGSLERSDLTIIHFIDDAGRWNVNFMNDHCWWKWHWMFLIGVAGMWNKNVSYRKCKIRILTLWIQNFHNV